MTTTTTTATATLTPREIRAEVWKKAAIYFEEILLFREDAAQYAGEYATIYHAKGFSMDEYLAFRPTALRR